MPFLFSTLRGGGVQPKTSGAWCPRLRNGADDSIHLDHRDRSIKIKNSWLGGGCGKSANRVAGVFFFLD